MNRLRGEKNVRVNHVIIRETYWIEVTAYVILLQETDRGNLTNKLGGENGSEGSSNDEVNLTTDTISQINLYGFINPDGGTISNDEGTSSTNAVGRNLNGRSSCVDSGWRRAVICGVVVWWRTAVVYRVVA